MFKTLAEGAFLAKRVPEFVLFEPFAYIAGGTPYLEQSRSAASQLLDACVCGTPAKRRLRAPRKRSRFLQDCAGRATRHVHQFALVEHRGYDRR